MRFTVVIFLILAVTTFLNSVAVKSTKAQECSFITMRDATGVITIHNKTNIRLNYQIRAKQNGKLGDWSSNSVRRPRTGWSFHALPNADAIQIRFDRIGGDGEFTEKIYDLEFNWVAAGQNICRHKGRSYKFEFDRGGRLLDLYRHGW